MMALLQNAPDDSTVMQQYIDTNPAFDERLKQYELYFKSVMGGALGPTARYWAIYIFMVNRIHRELIRALRTNDVSSYISILPAVIDIFFGLNRPNYARWGCYSCRNFPQLHRRPEVYWRREPFPYGEQRRNTQEVL